MLNIFNAKEEVKEGPLEKLYDFLNKNICKLLIFTREWPKRYFYCGSTDLQFEGYGHPIDGICQKLESVH